MKGKGKGERGVEGQPGTREDWRPGVVRSATFHSRSIQCSICSVFFFDSIFVHLGVQNPM